MIRVTQANRHLSTPQELQILGALTVACLVGSGMFHFLAVHGEHQLWWGYGGAILASGIAHVLYAAGLLLRRPRLALSACYLAVGIGILVADMGLYFISRTTGIPFIGPMAGHAMAVGPYDLSAKALQAAGTGLLLWMLFRNGYHPRGARASNAGSLKGTLLQRTFRPWSPSLPEASSAPSSRRSSSRKSWEAA